MKRLDTFRRHVRLLNAVAVTGGLALLVSACITNPGPFTITVNPGSSVVLKDSGGTPTRTFSYNDPACSDGSDNDLDGSADYPTDTQCSSASDSNERLAGFQTYDPPTLPIEIDAAGAITFDPTDLEFPQSELCLSSAACLGVTAHGTGTTQSGQFDSEAQTVSLTLPLTLEIDNLIGFGDIGANCAIGPVTPTLVSDTYNTTTGATTFTATGVPVPTASGCGANYNSLIDSYAGLPGTADFTIHATILDAEGNPIAHD